MTSLKQNYLLKISELTRHYRAEGKTVALITGCFDILHFSHIELFRFAKKNADIVIVGLENDKTINLSKGPGRPIHNAEQRTQSLEEFRSIDHVFVIEEIVDYASANGYKIYEIITKRIKPTYLVTDPVVDKFWKEKKDRAKKNGIKCLLVDTARATSTTKIINKLQSEF